jgi:AcrR family transcriptional regulator
MESAPFSAIMTVAALVFPLMIAGITDASTTRRPSMPRTLRSGSTTARSSTPIAQVPTAWYSVCDRFLAWSASVASSGFASAGRFDRQAGLRDRYFGESFSDLDALLAAVYERLIDEELTACRAAIDAATGPSAKARAMIDTLTRALEGNPGRARIKLREVVSGGPESREQRKSGLRKLSQLVADLLPEADAVDDRERLFLGLGVVAAADAYALAWLDGELDVSRQDVVDHVMLLFDAIAARITLSRSR